MRRPKEKPPKDVKLRVSRPTPSDCRAWKVSSTKRERLKAALFLFLWATMHQTIVAEISPGRRVVGRIMLGAIGSISVARYHGVGVPIVAGVVGSVAVVIIIGVVVAEISIGGVAIAQRATRR